MSLFIQTHGSGAPLLLIPGFASGIWGWFRQIDELAKDFTVITFDPRGIGRSRTLNPTVYSMDSFVDDIVEVLNRTENVTASMVGASFGGFVAQEFAYRFPERLNKLVLACTTSGGVKHVRADAEIMGSFTPDPAMTVGERIRRFIRPAFSEEFNTSHAAVVEDVCRMREDNPVDESLYMAQLTGAFAFDATAKLGEIKAPTLVISGDRDRVVPVENSHRLASGIPNARLEIVEGGSHMFFVENADEFNVRVRNFLLETL